jgi:hypothetical protein
MEKSSQIAWKLVPLRHYFPLKILPLIEVLLYHRFCYQISWNKLTINLFEFEFQLFSTI